MTEDWRSIDPPPGWTVPDREQARHLEDQLARELKPGNPVYGRSLVAIFQSDTDRDDVIFAEDKGMFGEADFWLVHLTWSETEDPHLPHASRFDIAVDLSGDDDDE